MGTTAIHCDTLIVLADEVGFWTASEGNIALIGSLSLDNSALIILAFGVCETRNLIGTFIGTFAIDCDTGETKTLRV